MVREHLGTADPINGNVQPRAGHPFISFHSSKEFAYMAQTIAPGTNRSVVRETETHRVKETRRSFQTTEFFVMVASIAALIVVGYSANDSLDAARIWTLVTV